MLLNGVGITKKFKRAQMWYKGKETEDMTQVATSLKDTMMKLFLKQQKEHDEGVVVDVSGSFIAQDSYSWKCSCIFYPAFYRVDLLLFMTLIFNAVLE